MRLLARHVNNVPTHMKIGVEGRVAGSLREGGVAHCWVNQVVGVVGNEVVQQLGSLRRMVCRGQVGVRVVLLEGLVIRTENPLLRLVQVLHFASKVSLSNCVTTDIFWTIFTNG